MLKRIVLICGVIAVAYAAFKIVPQEPKPDKFKNFPGCYIGKLDAVIPLGEKRIAPAPDCKAYGCGIEKVPYIISCSPVKLPNSSCKLISDSTKTYPGCCPKIKCS